MNKPSTHDEWKARSAKENLDILGWSRARTFVPQGPIPSAKSAVDHSGIEDEPVARMLADWLWWSSAGGSALPTRSLFKLSAKGKSEVELRSTGWPTDL